MFAESASAILDFFPPKSDCCKSGARASAILDFFPQVGAVCSEVQDVFLFDSLNF